MITYIDRVAVREREDGGISITHFSNNDMERYGYIDEDLFIAWYMNRIAPGETFNIFDRDKVPTDRSQRHAWSFKNKKLGIDKSKLVEKKRRK